MPAPSRNVEELVAEEFDGDACDHCCRYKKSGLSKRARQVASGWRLFQETESAVWNVASISLQEGERLAVTAGLVVS